MKIYLAMTQRKPSFQPDCLAPHYAFLDGLRQSGVLLQAGGFSDKSGGAYTFKAESFAQAQALVDTDPLHTTNSSLITLYEWNT